MVLPFWFQLTRVVPDKIQEGCKMVACVCVCFDTVGWVSGRATACKKISDEVLAWFCLE